MAILIHANDSYLKKLEAEVHASKFHATRERAEPSNHYPNATEEQSGRSSLSDVEVSNPLFEPRNGFLEDKPSAQPAFIGEAACTAFGDRLLQCVEKKYTASPAMPNHFQHPTFRRLLSGDFQLPDRIHANLVIRVALRFIGNDYHLFLKKAFFEKLESTYRVTAQEDLVWLCKVFVLLALGELYSHRTRASNSHNVPGTGYFLQAVSLLQDLHETPSVMQVEVLLLMVSASQGSEVHSTDHLVG